MPICRQTYIIGKKFPFNYMCELLRSDLRFRGGKLRCDVLMRWLPQTCGGTDCHSQQRRWHTSMPCRWGGSTGAWPRMWRWFCECAGVITNSILCLCFTQLEAVPDYYGAIVIVFTHWNLRQIIEYRTTPCQARHPRDLLHPLVRFQLVVEHLVVSLTD